MNFELYIENLGAIEKVEITINPLTILAGENGTGKSFVTKFLYSVLNVLMRDVYKMELSKNIKKSLEYISEMKEFWSQGIYEDFLSQFSFLNMIEIYDEKIIKKLIKDTDDYKKDLDVFVNDSKNFINNYNYNDKELNDKNDLIFKYSKIEMISKSIHFYLDKVMFLVGNKNSIYQDILKDYIISEIKDNFQISNISQIIKKGKEKLIFKIKDIVEIEIIGDNLSVKDFQITNNLSKINRLAFFESPIYWRLSMELVENSSRPKNYYLSDKISDERLTGVPKYFLDLRELLFSRFEKGEKETFIEECADDLQKNLNGKFNTDSYDLSFETNQGQTINKTLVSFGMTNLGILQAVLNKNIINKGSFVFIDEPESNLHPEWQAVLADILVKLAENGVFVVITTHSSDMLKALDVYSSNKEQNQFVSVNYFEKEGNLAIFDKSSVENVGVLSLVRNKLLEPYASFTFYKKGGFFDD